MVFALYNRFEINGVEFNTSTSGTYMDPPALARSYREEKHV
jgi:hypothetical protein